MDEFTTGIVGVISGLLIGFLIGAFATHNGVMEEAYERGAAVQCLGEEGYHWECDDDE